MNTKNTTKNVGASTTVLAPQKERVFFINVTKTDTRIRLVNNAPQQQQEQRIRAD